MEMNVFKNLENINMKQTASMPDVIQILNGTCPRGKVCMLHGGNSDAKQTWMLVENF